VIGPGDVGSRFVKSVFETLMVDAEWSLSGDRAFTWWPHDFSQRIFAGEPFEDAGVEGCRVHAETDLLLIDSPRPGLDETLAALVRFPPLSALTTDSGAGRVRLWSSVFVHEALAPFLVPRFALAAALQATYADLGREALVKMSGLPAVTSGHPDSGSRTRPDDMLNLAAARVVPAGEGASRWGGAAELLGTAEALAARGARAVPEAGGLSARFPFTQGAGDPFAPESSSLLQVRTGEPHPELGHGVFLRLFLPHGVCAAAGTSLASAALRLNGLERDDRTLATACLGGWCVEQSEPEVANFAVGPSPPRLAYVLFLPNCLHVPGALVNLAVDMGMRALWAAHVLSHVSALP
jgi:hypothetical protein